VAYPLSLRHVEEMMQERGVVVDTPLCIAGQPKCCRCWPPFFGGANDPLA
jgi:hypothetical protein